MWALGVAYVVSHAANKMVGFHPLLLLAVPVWGAVAIVSLALLFTRWRFVGYGGIFATLCVGTALLGMRAVWKWSYAYHISESARDNEMALATLKTAKQMSVEKFFNGLYDVTNLVPVAGSRWYDKSSYVAVDGVFWGANVVGIPHVRLEKVRHGWWGLALVDSTNDLVKLDLAGVVKYSPTKSEKLWVWNTGQ